MTLGDGLRQNRFMRWAKRVARWLYVIAANLSLLLFVCSVVFWVRSYFVEYVAGPRNIWWTSTAPGEVEYHQVQIRLECCSGALRVKRRHLYSVRFRTSEMSHLRPGWCWSVEHNSPPRLPLRIWERGFTYLVDGLGFRLGYVNWPQRKIGQQGVDVVSGAAPMWAVVVLFALMPAIRCVRWIRRKPKRDGTFCEKCGYDLRESKERCPECGLVVESEKWAGFCGPK